MPTAPAWTAGRPDPGPGPPPSPSIPTKVVAGAEGGMILTPTRPFVTRPASIGIRERPVSSTGGHVRMGSAWRMSEVQAAVALVHLRRLDEFIATRRAIAARYDEAFAAGPSLTRLTEPTASCSNYYKYLALLDPGIDRSALKQALQAEFGVSMSGEVYATPLHREPVFAEFADAALPVAEDICSPADLPARSLRHDRGGGGAGGRRPAHGSGPDGSVTARALNRALFISGSLGKGHDVLAEACASALRGPRRRVRDRRRHAHAGAGCGCRR